ncbi:MAG: C10 family peptidase [Candidatus Marinimicrobia bacterium]|nr:C10 family peptidase [Candidatus Neomarinimicrobiota bacterium]MDD5710125.1 C10 family peptidase [Candidatus Neomarinimicrobiota bacterium]
MKSTRRSISLMLTCLAMLFARPVTPEEALVFARDFFPQKTLQESRAINDVLYLYNFQEGGFLLMSSDDAFPAILAYSESGRAGEPHPAFLEFCEQFAREIRDEKAALRQRHLSWDIQSPALFKKTVQSEIEPLITSTWNQAPYYNQYFPYFTVPNYTDRRAYAGCVAVTAGQLLRYYRHPVKGLGYREYYSNDTDSLLSVAFDTAYYDWEFMPDSLTTRYGGLTAGMDQVREVAQLLFQIAVSVEMELKPDGSSASFDDLIYALVAYFDYDPGMRILRKDQYDAVSWRNLLTDELDRGYPIAYSGQGSGGHAFLCDGYRLLPDSLDYFHMNWGWGGAYDGWFMLTALTPSSGYDYSGEQQAIFDIRPNNDAITRLAYSGFEGWQSGWAYEGLGFVEENGSYDMVYSGTYAYAFDAADQWLITPKIRIADRDSVVLSFYAKMLNSGRQCDILLSQSDTAPAAFSEKLGTIAPHTSSWNEYRYDLSDYRGRDVHIAFRYLSSAGFIAVDEFCISMPKSNTGIAEGYPDAVTFMRNDPNPFNARTRIFFYLADPGDVFLNIYNLHGRLVHSLPPGRRETGSHILTWDATALPSGIYLAVLKAGNTVLATHKLLLVK